MNILMLTDLLRARVGVIFEQYRLEDGQKDAPAGATKAVTIYDGFAPKVRRGAGGQAEGPEPPFAMVRLNDGEDTADGDVMVSTVTVDIYLVTERPDDDGYRDIASMIERLRTGLLSRPYLEDENGKQFRIERPLNWVIQEDDGYPQWMGLVTCSINAPQPVELFDDEVHYGN